MRKGVEETFVYILIINTFFVSARVIEDLEQIYDSATNPKGVIQANIECNTRNCQFAVIANLGDDSKVQERRGIKWKSKLKFFTLTKENGEYNVNVKEEENISTTLANSLRAGDFSELVVYEGNPTTSDAKTGIVYTISNHDRGHKLFPARIFNAGNGEKNEHVFNTKWMTTRGDFLLLGGDGMKTKSVDNSWVIFSHKDGQFRRSWESGYKAIQSALGAINGFITIGDCIWDDVGQRFLFFPASISQNPFEEQREILPGASQFVSCTLDFQCDAITSSLSSDKRFSSIQFVPGTNNREILAVRNSVEGSKTFVSIFNNNGSIVMPEKEISSSEKYQGLMFTDEKFEPIEEKQKNLR